MDFELMTTAGEEYFKMYSVQEAENSCIGGISSVSKKLGDGIWCPSCLQKGFFSWLEYRNKNSRTEYYDGCFKCLGTYVKDLKSGEIVGLVKTSTIHKNKGLAYDTPLHIAVKEAVSLARILLNSNDLETYFEIHKEKNKKPLSDKTKSSIRNVILHNMDFEEAIVSNKKERRKSIQNLYKALYNLFHELPIVKSF